MEQSIKYGKNEAHMQLPLNIVASEVQLFLSFNIVETKLQLYFYINNPEHIFIIIIEILLVLQCVLRIILVVYLSRPDTRFSNKTWCGGSYQIHFVVCISCTFVFRCHDVNGFVAGTITIFIQQAPPHVSQVIQIMILQRITLYVIHPVISSTIFVTKPDAILNVVLV